MNRSMQWLSLIGGILILGYGIYKLLGQPQPEWTPMILGLLIVAFSVSKIVKSSAGKGGPGKDR
jgi:small neutral amino acid transporter SnatA (MarC family)